ncbi:RDD family protein [Bacillus sp. FJAT-49705]|uniref:RDD family protein n=1 Tax=Cytobacillus citreus TaxID=2833586 RepID=A0ABS5NZM6_9BACI|nr:RDD family protein [Cytobacillus citreus]MBS4193300.1 RDD family protein [Cytobacillus citreus]
MKADSYIAEDEQKLATFIERGIAICIDGIIISLLYYVAYVLLFIDVIGPLFLLLIPYAYEYGALVAFLFWLLFIWLYFACMESSRYQGTIGKHLLKLKVTSEFGEQLSFKKSTIRFFMKIVSFVIVLAGFIMALFTKKNQALHDVIAHTVVLKE